MRAFRSSSDTAATEEGEGCFDESVLSRLAAVLATVGAWKRAGGSSEGGGMGLTMEAVGCGEAGVGSGGGGGGEGLECLFVEEERTGEGRCCADDRAAGLGELRSLRTRGRGRGSSSPSESTGGTATLVARE